jgi:hypothetical protein
MVDPGVLVLLQVRKLVLSHVYHDCGLSFEQERGFDETRCSRWWCGGTKVELSECPVARPWNGISSSRDPWRRAAKTPTSFDPLSGPPACEKGPEARINSIYLATPLPPQHLVHSIGQNSSMIHSPIFEAIYATDSSRVVGKVLLHYSSLRTLPGSRSHF